MKTAVTRGFAGNTAAAVNDTTVKPSAPLAA
jgi:hypothetical protein